MKRLLAAVTISCALFGVPSVAFAAGNPSGTGQPSQSCQTIELVTGGTTPGSESPLHGAPNSPGSPFNEAGINSTTGGKGGINYTKGNSNSPNTKAVAQYDVACYHVSQRR